MIYHVTTQTWWHSCEDQDNFESPDLDDEGFIHCCTSQQLRLVINKYFRGMSDLVILHIDPDLLEEEVRYESSGDTELFPHVYGKISRNSIIHTEFYKSN